MASDSLVIKISPTLLEALSIPGETGAVDYFGLLGVDRQALVPAEIDRAVMARSKALRPWQNSPQHGEEVVKLLPMLHRIASILKDPPRCKAYETELERQLRGEQIDPLVEFADMVRAALVGGSIDQASKAELIRFATEKNIPMPEVGRVVNEIAAATKEAAPPPEEEREFKIAGGGPDFFRSHVGGLLRQGTLTAELADSLVAEADRFSVNSREAREIVNGARLAHFRSMIAVVAQSGAINNNQARLLMPKAAALGINPDQAYALLSEYMFTGASQEEVAALHLTTSGFDDEEIGSLLQRQSGIHFVRRQSFATVLFQSTGGRVLIGGVLLLLAAVAAQDWIAGLKLPKFGGGSAEVTPTPSPTPVAAQTPPPDPPTGVLAIAPGGANDPPAFQVKIHEVTCAEYREFLIAKLYPKPPTGWGLDYSYPAGHDSRPVTGVTWEDATQFCRWEAQRRKLAEGSVRLPNLREFNRLTRGKLLGERTIGDAGFWSRSSFAKSEPGPVKSSTQDVLLFPGGWVYDLLANAAEWGEDERTGERIVFGGDYAQSDPGFSPLTPRYHAPATSEPTIGFRYVITGTR